MSGTMQAWLDEFVHRSAFLSKYPYYPAFLTNRRIAGFWVGVWAGHEYGVTVGADSAKTCGKIGIWRGVRGLRAWRFGRGAARCAWATARLAWRPPMASSNRPVRRLSNATRAAARDECSTAPP